MQNTFFHSHTPSFLFSTRSAVSDGGVVAVGDQVLQAGRGSLHATKRAQQFVASFCRNRVGRQAAGQPQGGPHLLVVLTATRTGPEGRVEARAVAFGKR